MGYENVPEWLPDELDCLEVAKDDVEVDVDVNATQPIPESIKCNFPLPIVNVSSQDANAEFIEFEVHSHQDVIESADEESQQSMLEEEADVEQNNNQTNVKLTPFSAMFDHIRVTRAIASSFKQLSSTSISNEDSSSSSGSVKSKPKRASNKRFTCHCKRTFRSEKSFEEHRKTH